MVGMRAGNRRLLQSEGVEKSEGVELSAEEIGGSDGDSGDEQQQQYKAGTGFGAALHAFAQKEESPPASE